MYWPFGYTAKIRHQWTDTVNPKAQAHAEGMMEN